MKIAKKVLAIAIAVGMIFCLTAMAFAGAQTTSLEASEVEDGKFTVTVYVLDAEGLETFDTAVNYDAAVLSINSRTGAKIGAWSGEYDQIGEGPVSAFNLENAGEILPGIAIAEHIYGNDEFKGIWSDCDLDGAPTADADKLALFTLTFKVADDAAKETTITCGDASVTVNLKAAEEAAAKAAEEASKKAAEEAASKAAAEKAAAEEASKKAAEEASKKAAAEEASKKAAAEEASKLAAEKAAKEAADKAAAEAAAAKKAANSSDTGDSAVLAVATGVCALAAAAFVVTKKRK